MGGGVGVGAGDGGVDGTGGGTIGASVVVSVRPQPDDSSHGSSSAVSQTDRRIGPAGPRPQRVPAFASRACCMREPGPGRPLS
ncbi:MAG: hypothetical protein C0434_04505 [Xanthomonadaceae bacterium]|nr:hypothetical protein [Xanthomonadaceae bacterium]